MCIENIINLLVCDIHHDFYMILIYFLSSNSVPVQTEQEEENGGEVAFWLLFGYSVISAGLQLYDFYHSRKRKAEKEKAEKEMADYNNYRYSSGHYSCPQPQAPPENIISDKSRNMTSFIQNPDTPRGSPKRKSSSRKTLKEKSKNPESKNLLEDPQSQEKNDFDSSTVIQEEPTADSGIMSTFINAVSKGCS